MSCDAPRVVVLHAYDARNRGDGLLVRESLDLLERAGVNPAACTVVAMKAGTFGGASRVVQFPGAGEQGLRRVVGALGVGQMALDSLAVTERLPNNPLAWLAKTADLVVGVGGGYLRTGSTWGTTQAACFHLPQLAVAARSAVPAVYLPQSVGPLRGPVGRSIGRYTTGLEWIAARDDRTMEELPSHTAAFRAPDLAVLSLARTFSEISPRLSGERAALVARPLEGRADDFADRLRRLAALVDLEWAVHSRALGQNDAVFYEQFGVHQPRSTPDVFADHRTGVVISVRLHGALQTLLAGIPAIHLTYERKGYGAFGDLGLEEWLHPARSFDPHLVASQAEELLADSSRYWQRVRASLPAIIDSDNALLDRVRALVGAPLSLR